MIAFDTRFNLADYFLFDRLREGLGESVAVRFGARAYTYAEVADRSARAAAALTKSDVHPGERVLVVLPDTGESVPKLKTADDAVFAGTINTDAVLRVRVTAAAADNTIARVVKLVEEAQESGEAHLVPDLRKIHKAGKHLLRLINGTRPFKPVNLWRNGTK